MPLSLREIRSILKHQPTEPVSSTLRILRDEPVYNYGKHGAQLEYLNYEMETIDPETGEKFHFYKAIKLVRVIRLPKDAKQSTSMMDKHAQILSACYEENINFMTVIANIREPVALGLLFLYGVQGVDTTIKGAQEKAHRAFVGMVSALSGTYRVLEMRVINEQETEWLRDKLYNMDYAAVIRGIPYAANTGEDAGNKGAGGKNLNPDSQGTLEEIITGMTDYEYVIQILTTPVYQSTLRDWSAENERYMTDWNEQKQGTKGFSMNLSIPMMYAANQGLSQGVNRGYTLAESENTSQGTSFNTSYGENVGQALSESYGQSYGKAYGQSFSESISQTHTISQGVSVGQSFNVSLGQSHGQSIGQSLSNSQSQSISDSESHNVGQSFNESIGQNQGTSFGQSIGQSSGLSTGFSRGQSIGQNFSQSQGVSAGRSFGESFSQGMSQNHSVSQGMSRGESFGQSSTLGQTFGTSNNISKGMSQNTSFGHSEGQSTGHSTGQSMSESHGESMGNSYSTGISESQSTGQSQSESYGTSQSQGISHSYGQSSSSGWSQSESIGESHSVSGSKSQGYSEGTNSSNSTSVNIGSNHSEGNSHNVGGNLFGVVNLSGGGSKSDGTSASYGGSSSQGSSYGYNESISVSESTGRNISESQGMSGSAGISESVGNSISNGTSMSESRGTSFSQSRGASESFGESYGKSMSESYSINHSSSDSQSVSNSTSYGSGQSYSESQGNSQSISQSQGTSYGQNYGENTSETQGYGSSQSYGQNIGESYSQSSSQSVGQSYGENVSQSRSQSQSMNFGESQSRNEGQSFSQSTGQSTGDSTGRTIGQSLGVTKGVSMSNNTGTSRSVSEGKSYTVSQSESWSTSHGYTKGESLTESMSESTSKGATQSTGQSKSIGQGQNTSTSKGTSQSLSEGISTGLSHGTSASMGISPSIGYNKSYQWQDQIVTDIVEMLEYQNERLKRALRGNGAFHTYVYISCESEDAVSAAKTLAKSTWLNKEAMVNPLQVLDLDDSERKDILMHCIGFSAAVSMQTIGRFREYKYCSVLLPEELVAYTHLPRVSEGGLFTEVNDVPKFSTPSMLKGEIYMGTILNAERYSMQTGYRTNFEYRIDESELMHGIFAAGSRSGKTVAAMRFISQLAHTRRKATGKRLRIVCMDPKQDWRALANYVEAERFRFYSMGNTRFRPLKLNPLKIPHGVDAQNWIDGVINVFCRSYGLLERGKQMISEAAYQLYGEEGVFGYTDQQKDRLYKKYVTEYFRDRGIIETSDEDTAAADDYAIQRIDDEDRAIKENTDHEKISELSSHVTFARVYDRMNIIKQSMEGNKEAREEYEKLGYKAKGMSGNDTKDAYARLLDRLQAFNRKFSVEYQLFGTEEGISVDEMIGEDDVTVLESNGLEDTFRNFIFGVITCGFYKYAKAHEGGFLADDQYETVLVIEEANEVLVGSDVAGTGGGGSLGLQGPSEFERMLDQSAGYGLFIMAITQKISDMPKSIISNAGLIFAGRMKTPDDITAVVRAIAREDKFEDRDLVKWFPRSPTGWFICMSSRTYDFKDSEPILVQVDMLNKPTPRNADIEAMLTSRDSTAIRREYSLAQ